LEKVRTDNEDPSESGSTDISETRILPELGGEMDFEYNKTTDVVYRHHEESSDEESS
jgi:hypothetical protein